MFEMRQPAYSVDEVERVLGARMARQSIFERSPAPALTFVLEEVTLQRPIGGKMVVRKQLERLLEVASLRNLTVQVMPTDREEHAGLDGGIEILKFPDGSALGRAMSMSGGHPVSDVKAIRVLDLRYGMIRAQALTPRESMTLIEKKLGEA